MGTVINFPDDRRVSGASGARAQMESASIIILPVVRIERHADGTAVDQTPEAGSPGGGGRRRRGRRS
jgi:hypothetical protein